MLVSLHELEIPTPVHVGQGSSRSPAHTCTGKSSEVGECMSKEGTGKVKSALRMQQYLKG